MYEFSSAGEWYKFLESCSSYIKILKQLYLSKTKVTNNLYIYIIINIFFKCFGVWIKITIGTHYIDTFEF